MPPIWIELLSRQGQIRSPSLIAFVFMRKEQPGLGSWRDLSKETNYMIGIN
jgi:hypothetical protein